MQKFSSTINEKFINAVRGGDVEGVERALAIGDENGVADPNLEVEDLVTGYGKRCTPLHIACTIGKIAVVDVLLKQKGIDVNAKNLEHGNTALRLVCQFGHSDVVRLLLERHDVDVNSKNKCGNTALHIAAVNGHADIIKMLLRDKHAIVQSHEMLHNYLKLVGFPLRVVQVVLRHPSLDLRTGKWDDKRILSRSVAGLRLVFLWQWATSEEAKWKCNTGKRGGRRGRRWVWLRRWKREWTPQGEK